MTDPRPRLFVPAFALLIAACAASAARTTSPATAHAPLVVVAPTEPREQTADQQVQQVLNRLGFGPRPGDVAKVRAMGVDQWIGLQLAPDRIDDGAADRIVASYEVLGKPTSELVSMYGRGQAAIRKQQKSQAQSGDSSSKRDLRAQLLEGDPALREQLRQNQRILGDVQSAKLARAVVSDRQLDEVMVDFWENHFNIFAGKGVDRIFIPAFDRDVIRPNALGKFRDLLGAVAKSPAMLFYLDQWQSAADSAHPTLVAARNARGGARRAPAAGLTMNDLDRFAPNAQLTPAQRKRLAAMTPGQRMQVVQQRAQAGARAKRGLNENYARELMELHTLGVDGGYTQKDIIEVARALTGWTMNPRGAAEFVFRPEMHDAGQKVVLGHVIPAGGGVEDGEAVLDIVARNPATAHFIARKLATRFVSDTPSPALVERAAQMFLKTDGDIREVVRTIVTSPEFFSRLAYRSKVKSPFELVASALRAIDAQPDTTMRSAQMVGFLGAPIFGHQAPNGWPETGESWMNSGAILNRINFGLGLAAGRFPGATLAHWSETEQLTAATRDQQVDAVILAFFGGQSSPDTRQILLSGENPLAAKLAATVPADSVAMDMSAMSMGGAEAPVRRRMPAPAKNGAPRPGATRAMGQPVQLHGLAQVVGLAIGAPEFQRR
ncbi:MAG: DUF1800 domain-containing protein [Gemmatimonadota bacterium]|nr:DUF1800 domain-containing protein [Gemmatimonadota bacterium]